MVVCWPWLSPSRDCALRGSSRGSCGRSRPTAPRRRRSAIGCRETARPALSGDGECKIENVEWMGGSGCVGLGCRRSDAAHAPRLASEFLWVSVSANSALRAPQAVVNKPRVPRSPGMRNVKLKM